MNGIFQFVIFSVQEGSHLYEHGVDPYIGDVYHENPLILIATHFLIKNLNDFIPILFIIIDLITSVFIYYAAKHFTSKNVSQFSTELVNKLNYCIFFNYSLQNSNKK